jgi:hypothetical protein
VAGVIADTDSIRLQQRENPGEIREGQSEVCGAGCELTPGIETDGGERITPDTNGVGFPGKEHGQKKSGEHSQFSPIPNWHNFPTQSPVCLRNDGISSELVGITFPKHRNESIKAYGNAVVSQVVYQIFQAINHFNELDHHNRRR